MSIVLVDGGGTNIMSVRAALQRLGADAQLTSDAAAIRAADRVILPGVGAAAPGMARLREAGLVDVLRTLEAPLLGICLGMQLLFEGSEEGDVDCLGLLPGRVAAMRGGPGVRVPHMGWNALDFDPGEPLLDGIAAGTHAYFVHGYAAPVTAATVATTTHGEPFAAVVRQGRRMGAQFHPERSAAAGARLLKNFLDKEWP